MNTGFPPTDRFVCTGRRTNYSVDDRSYREDHCFVLLSLSATSTVVDTLSQNSRIYRFDLNDDVVLDCIGRCDGTGDSCRTHNHGGGSGE